MRPIYINYPSVAAAGFTTPPIVLDQYISPGNVSVTINVIATPSSAAALSVAIDFTTDNVLEPQVTNYIWQPWTASPFTLTGGQYLAPFTVNAGSSAAVEAAMTLAPKAVRVRTFGSVSGSPTMNVQVVQLGIGGT